MGMVEGRLNTTGQNHIQGNTQIGADRREWKALKVNKIAAGLQGMRLCKSDVKHCSQQGLLPVVHTAFSASHATSDELITQLCPFFLFTSLPTKVQAWKSLLLHKGEETEWLECSWQMLGVPWSQPHLQQGQLPKAWQHCPGGGQGQGKGRRTTVLGRKTLLKEQ